MNLEEFYARHNSRYSVRLIVAILFLIFSTAYFSWRITVFNSEALIFSVILFIAEFFGFIIIIITLFVTWKVKVRQPEIPPSDLEVDVFIPTYNESVDILRLTVLAVKNIRYPHGTWILDDGKRSDIKQLAEELGCKYLTREDNSHAKAGNLNNALKHSKADFIALFDADHVSEENYLDRLLGYFNDPNVAFVQSPQDFYNIDSFQFCNNKKQRLLWHDQSFFYQAGQAGRDYWNAATLCGTNLIIRRSAIDAIGGFATETVTEDMQTAVRLQKLGYKSVYHPESLAYGIAATTYVEFLQQRLRWGYGNIQTILKERIPFSKRLTIPQKLCYIALGLEFSGGWLRLVFYVTPIIVLFSGIVPISDTRLFFWFFIPYFLSAYFCIEEFGRGSTRFFVSEYMEMALFPVSILAIVGAFLNINCKKILPNKTTNKISIFLILPQLIILVLSIIAFIIGVLSPPESFLLTVSDGIIPFMCFMALGNTIFAASVIYSVILKPRTSDDYRFKIPLPIKVNINKHQPCIASVNNISVSGTTFTGSFKSTPQICETINCDIYLQNIRISVDAKIYSVNLGSDNSNYNISCCFNWSDIKNRDLLNSKLHACSWHRQFTWDNFYLKTTLEWIIIIINPFAWKYEMWPQKWAPVLFNYSNELDSDYRLGLIKNTKTPEKIYIISFIDLKKSGLIKIIKAGEDINKPKKIKIITDNERLQYNSMPTESPLGKVFYSEIIDE